MSATDRERLIRNLHSLRRLAEESLELLGARPDLPSPAGAHLPADVPDFNPDFGTPVRPFMKTYGKDLGGSKKLVLLLSWMTGGDTEKQVPLSDLKKTWKQMSGILGTDFNRFFAGDAKDHDWIEARSKGLYNLRPNWRAALRRADRG